MMNISIHNLTHRDMVSLFEYWRIIDSVENFSASFNEGTINGLIGELGHGGWLISSMLCGRVSHECIAETILVNGEKASVEILRSISCYVGEGVTESPYRKLRRYPHKWSRKIMGIRTVLELIQEGLRASGSKESPQKIAEMFELSGIDDHNERIGRVNRPVEYQSGEVWRATMAIGMAYQKKIFCFPWLEPHYVGYVLSRENRKYIAKLRDHGKIILIPVSHEGNLVDTADQIIHLKKGR